MTLWLPEKKGERLFRVKPRGHPEEIVSARNHTEAKVKAAKWFVYAASRRFPDVEYCRLVKGVH
jgi:hypothetical protein